MFFMHLTGLKESIKTEGEAARAATPYHTQVWQTFIL